MLAPGAHADEAGTSFVVWSTRAHEVSVRLFDASGGGPRAALRAARTERLVARGEGRFERYLPGVLPGALYLFVLDGEEVPDPYARFLPYGVHGPARVVARVTSPPLPAPAPLSQWVIYELHVGTFTPEGTYRGALAKLGHLERLGVTAIELLPIAAFPGERGWGYDGVSLYAPFAAYGEPDDLRAFLAAAHQRGIAVLLDVVYNHFGPSGNYLGKYSPEYFSREVQTPWGPAPDYAHAPMRGLVLDNVGYWLEELGFDGLRLDATHEIHDPSAEHILRAITDLAHRMTPPRRVFFEDDRNDPSMVCDLGADGIWADDFHHQVHALMTGERDGYYGAYAPDLASLARTINEGWTFTGQPFAPWDGKPRGAPARACALAPRNLVYCLQNHDQVGNRALGTRLTAHVTLDGFCAASVLLLSLPATPLVFMGQEWAATTPFLFFSDHEGELGDAVRRGRREELKAFAAFADPRARDAIPDPQAVSTFERSRLVWEERARGDHPRVLTLHRDLIALRRSDAVLGAASGWQDLEARVVGDEVLEVVRRRGDDTRRILVNFGAAERPIPDATGLRVLLQTGTYREGRLGPRGAIILASR